MIHVDRILIQIPQSTRRSGGSLRHTGLLTILLGIAAGCGGAQSVASPSIDALVKTGQCERVLDTLMSTPLLRANNKGAWALCSLVLQPDTDVANDVTTTLTATGHLAPVNQMLTHAETMTPPPDISVTLLLAQVAIDTGHGLTLSHEHHTTLLGRVVSWLATTIKNTSLPSLPPHMLRPLLHDAFTIIYGDTPIPTSSAAWQMFTGLVELGILLWNDEGTADFNLELLDAAIVLLKNHPEIAVAARCDIGSPYDKLKKRLSTDRSRSAALERAVKIATGCSRGRYAPTVSH